MKLKLRYHRASAKPADIAVVTDLTATVGDLAEEISRSDPSPVTPGVRGRVTLAVAEPGGTVFAPLPPDRTVGESTIASGHDVRIVSASALRPAGGPVTTVRAALVVEDGPHAGQRFPLVQGTYVLGRGAECDIVLADPLVSKAHARMEVGSTVELVDLNSANGILVDGGLVPRLELLDGQAVVLGDTTVRISVYEAGIGHAARVVAATVPFNRSPRVQPRYPGQEFQAPEIPQEVDPPLFPWLLMVAPVVFGFALFVATGRPESLLFVAMSPMMMLGNFAMGRKRARRQHDSATSRFEAQLAALLKQLQEEVPREQAVRDAETPRAGAVRAAAASGSDLLWTRRPEHWAFLHVRLGTGTTESRNSVVASERSQGLVEYAARLSEVVEHYRSIDLVPVVESPLLSGAIGIVGDGPTSYDVARAILLQWVGLHSPTELVVTALASPAATEHLEWLKWLPHSSSPHSPVASTHLTDSPATSATLLAELEQLVSERSAARRSRGEEMRPDLEQALHATGAGARVGHRDSGDEAAPPLPVVVLVVSHDATVDRGRLVQLLERSASVGVIPLFVGAARSDLPAACRTFVDVSRGLAHGEVHFVRHGTTLRDVVIERVSRDEAMNFARQLSGLVDSGAVVADESDLPTSVPMLDLLGHDMADSALAVVDRWRQNFSLDSHLDHRPAHRRATLRALVGQAGADAMHLDLRSQGPHALVGGTTGAGKSEFLQTWVLGMAAEYSPERVTFLFVDYKGGSAFAECVDLPHCVGLVTDLTEHLVSRALTSLLAELRHRERVLNLKKAKDLIELEKRGDPEWPPALVLVVDEFAALVADVPAFVDGVVDIAQRGRSLGIHLVLATQRPAGVIKDSLRANTNLRIALRMADENDSMDVVGSPLAARFDPGIPGRALAKTGPGRLVQFQSAYAGGWSSRDETRPDTVVTDLRFGAETRWQRPGGDEVPVSVDPGPTDQSRLVASIRAAAADAEVGPPRRPWLDELGASYDLSALAPVTDQSLAIGMSDLPSVQLQQPVHFRPDQDGHLSVFGTGGSGKSVVLRTLAAAAGLNGSAGPTHVYGLDFSSGGLRMLEVLPYVGSVVPGEDTERVVRLLRMLKLEIERRGRDYSAADADSVVEFRQHTGNADEARILLLVDGYPAFRADYEGVPGRVATYAAFQQLLSEGRQLGIHVVITADRPASVPGSVSSSIPRRVVLRLAEDTMYTLLDVPAKVLGPDSPPGRAVLDQHEVQIAVLGGAGTAREQSGRLSDLAERLRSQGCPTAPGVASLPTELREAELPEEVLGEPVLGLCDDDLGPIGFTPEGTFLLGGGPGAGRSNGLLAISRSLRRWDPKAQLFYLGGRRSTLAAEPLWDGYVTGITEASELARELSARVAETDPADERMAVVIESLSDFLQTPADAPLVELVKTIKRCGHLVVAESETSSWASSWPLFAEIKAGRRGLLLRPDTLEGETLLKTSFPRVNRNEFPVGRGLFAQRGKAVRVQLPLARRHG